MLVSLLVISNVAFLHMNFNFSMKVLWVPSSNIFTIANLDISPRNGVLTFINLCSLGFRINLCSSKMGTHQFRNLKQQSLEFITPSNLNIFLCLTLSQYFHEFLTLMCKFQICAHAHL